MQSFIVTPRSANPGLKVNATMTTVSVEPENAFRSANSELPANRLDIFALRGSQLTKTLVLYDGTASTDYRPDEDSRKLFPVADPTSLLVYTRSKDDYALAINTSGGFDDAVALGIHTSEPGEITLRFTGMENFENNSRIRLHDIQENRIIDLSQHTEYTFTKDGEEPYLENRFFLTFSDATDIRLTPVNTSIVVQQLAGQTVRIATDNSTPLGRMQIINIQGQVLFSQEVTESSYVFRAPAPGIYIVRVNETVRKLRVKN
jgi:hypothetical protein